MEQHHSITLNTCQQMPVIGLGTWKSSKDKAGGAVKYAIEECGYRHIDCASIYNNEKEIGESFKDVFSKKINREDVFITSKLWNTSHARNKVMDACKQTLQDLQLDYLDLYLMHWGIAVPENSNTEPLDENGCLITAPISILETWKVMEELINAGLVRNIGVANFTGMMITDLLACADIKPAMNQIELHPYNTQSQLVQYCRRLGIAVTAYSPLGRPGNFQGKNNNPLLIQDLEVVKIAKKYNKTPAQALIRWAIQRNTAVIPKSVTFARIKENMDVFDFALSDEDMDALSNLKIHRRFVDSWDWWKIPYFN